MGQYEIIDRFCEITTLMSEIIKKQAETIEQSEISNEVKAELAQMRSAVDERLDAIEYNLRKH